MQPKGCVIEISNFLGGIHERQNLLDLAFMLWVHPSRVVIFEEPPQPFMLKALDHCRSSYDECKILFYMRQASFYSARCFGRLSCAWQEPDEPMCTIRTPRCWALSLLISPHRSAARVIREDTIEEQAHYLEK